MKRYFEKNITDKKNFVKKRSFLSMKEQNLGGYEIFTKIRVEETKKKKKRFALFLKYHNAY